MKCKQCSQKIKMNAEPPGLFLLIAIICLLVSLPAGLFISPMFTMGLWLAALVALCAALINVGDNKSMASDGSAQKGMECRNCGQVNKVYPWTL
jgi:hypothetical protein